MVTAFILIKAVPSRIQAIAQEALDVPGIVEAYSVAGLWDLVAVARVRKNDELAGVVTESMIGISGITETNTLIAFRQYSSHDLEAMFGLGAET